MFPPKGCKRRGEGNQHPNGLEGGTGGKNNESWKRGGENNVRGRDRVKKG